MHGPVELWNKEVLSILHQWKLNYQDTMNLTTHQKSSFSMKRKRKNGKKWMKKIDHLILFLGLLIKWDTFLFMTDWFNKDSKDVWICICVQESRRKNLTLILILSFLNFPIQKHSNHSQLLLTSHTIVIQALLVQFQSHQADNTFAQATKAVFSWSGK